jgi:hypothetical protein
MTGRMAQTLVNMYHGRIKYPWQREAEEAAARAQREGAETTPVSVGLRGGASGPDAAPSATTPPTDDAPASAKRPARP